jgi:hypothetical protein
MLTPTYAIIFYGNITVYLHLSDLCPLFQENNYSKKEGIGVYII